MLLFRGSQSATGAAARDKATEDAAVKAVMKVPASERYKSVWTAGYLAALDDVKAGRLVLVQGETRPILKVGP